MTVRNRCSSLSLAVFAALIASNAAAQDAAPADAPAREAAAGKDATDLDSVIVTVERRAQSLQKFAGTAQALSQDDLRGLGINNELRQIQVAVPGLSIANQEGATEVFIRGVGSSNNTELGDPGAAPHVNGAYIPRPRGLGAMFYDLERVEINKGPQGTLRGRNALAGTLNIITKKPELGGDFSGYVQGEVGNRDQKGYETAVNFPLGEYAALRFAGYHVEKEAGFKNAGLWQHIQSAGIQDDSAGRLSFLYEPDDKLSVFAMLDVGRELGTGYPGAGVFEAARAGFQPDDIDMRAVVYRGVQGKVDNKLWGFQGTVRYDFGGVNLEYNGSYRDVDYFQINSAADGNTWPGRDLRERPPGQPATWGGIDYDNFGTNYLQARSQSQTHELRLSSDDDARFRWTTGGFYFHEKQQVGFMALADKGAFYSGTEFTMPDVDGKSWAVFGDGTFDVNDRLRVKGGLRYTDERKSRDGIGGNWAIGLGGDGGVFQTRLGTEGFMPSLLNRPSFHTTGLVTDADKARYLLDGILRAGARDTMQQQLQGIVDGSRPNGTCIDRPDIGGNTVNCPANGQHSFISLGIPSEQHGSSAFDFLDWRLGFEYDLSDRNLLYATVSTGHKAGGFNDSFDVNVIPETYKPEELTALEIGSKNSFEFFGRTSTFNVSGFYYDYQDQVFQDLTTIAFDPDGRPNGFALVNRNVGKSELYGIEAESRLRLGAGFTLDLNALYLKTQIKQGMVADVRSQDFGNGGITSQIDLTGNELPLSSEFTFNARLQQAIDFSRGTFDWQILAAHRSSFFLTQYNDRDVTFLRDASGAVARVEDATTAGFPDKQKGFTQVNAGIGFSSLSGAWRVEAWGSNLTNKDVSQKALVGSGVNTRFLNDARSYGVRVRWNF
ncbi:MULTISPECIES: TonB-dependent receptor [unclassified Lysobacter]|uniref:TonB-dependent receptor n=1 Tax=unclassified Lysobacter TaxID=2635362 RepID=UPI001BEB8A1C|nr:MULTISPECIES: TonB-dependent receptor [unclassified Lysobacter]MBT2747252.1 TonB-dependent receptor [Lysobacter sp. ISL-42]MBT2750244.1 TonB-dependent receptor [Lysobacter sp. ISL-50]MBT2777790.1 TonB-dependent receptor [Lysobacter sp. ISL-54]MBT2783726.1 TonB-dependent receptor [Lysobacter sp. ISL-52]